MSYKTNAEAARSTKRQLKQCSFKREVQASRRHHSSRRHAPAGHQPLSAETSLHHLHEAAVLDMFAGPRRGQRSRDRRQIHRYAQWNSWHTRSHNLLPPAVPNHCFCHESGVLIIALYARNPSAVRDAGADAGLARSGIGRLIGFCSI